MPRVRIDSLESRVVDFLGLWVGNLRKQIAVSGDKLGCEKFLADILRARDDPCANAVALALGNLHRGLLPAPCPDHVPGSGCRSGRTGQDEKHDGKKWRFPAHECTHVPGRTIVTWKRSGRQSDHRSQRRIIDPERTVFISLGERNREQNCRPDAGAPERIKLQTGPWP